MKKSAALVMAAVVALGGCSSIVNGTSQDVMIGSDPSGADCGVSRDGRSVGRVNPTPGVVRVSRSGDDLTVLCNAGSMSGAETVEAGMSWWTLMNVFLPPPLIGGAIGFLIDGVTGSYHDYDDVNVDLK